MPQVDCNSANEYDGEDGSRPGIRLERADLVQLERQCIPVLTSLQRAQEHGLLVDDASVEPLRDGLLALLNGVRRQLGKEPLIAPRRRRRRRSGAGRV